ncbi:helix-turn-helix domain-containing protein [Planobispora longispora]|uniref:helix-turn-helix domain-containing protein n=1 Tax=Planobispora longispora TaxID=28887 RepID=UPI001940D2F0
MRAASAAGPDPRLHPAEPRRPRSDAGIGRRGAPHLAAIAARWGFTSPAHFSQVFRGTCGLSPRRFRRRSMRGHPGVHPD